MSLGLPVWALGIRFLVPGLTQPHYQVHHLGRN